MLSARSPAADSPDAISTMKTRRLIGPWPFPVSVLSTGMVRNVIAKPKKPVPPALPDAPF